MKKLPCLCDNRVDIRCQETHCDIAGPGAAGNANQCRVCWLRLHKPPPRPASSRSSPCFFLGDVVDKRGCACPSKWIRICAVHKVCTIERCKTCPDYEE